MRGVGTKGNGDTIPNGMRAECFHLPSLDQVKDVIHIHISFPTHCWLPLQHIFTFYLDLLIGDLICPFGAY